MISIQAIIILLAYLSSLCYDRAIVVAENDFESLALTKICIKIIIPFSIIFLFILLIPECSKLIINYNLPLYIKFIIFIWLIIASINIVLQSLNTRYKLYKQMSIRQIKSSILSTILQTLYGILHFGFLGLLLSYVISAIYGAYLLSKGFTKKLIQLPVTNTKEIIYKYKGFPKYQLLGVILDTGSMQLVIILINSFFGAELAGQYSLANKVLAIPMTLIGATFAQVFYQEFSERFSQNNAPLKFLLNTWKKLFILGIIPIGVLFLFSEPLFIFVFGNKWYLAGWFAKYLCIMTFIMLISGSTSSALIVIGEQRWFLFITFIYFIFRLFSVYLMKYQSLKFGLCVFILLEVVAIILYNIPILLSLRRLHQS